MKVASIQFASTPNAPEANRQTAAALINEAADKGASLVVLPELWPTGLAARKAITQAESMRDTTVTLLRQLAKLRKVYIVGGSFAEKKDGRLYNTVVAVDERGEITAKYRKTHLYPQEEEEVFTQGDEWVSAECAGIRLGVISGQDIYFPEFARNLALRGAQLLVAPLLLKENIEEVHLLARARALENSCFVIVANQARDMAAGRSIIISPGGAILAEAKTKDTILMAELDTHNLVYLRQKRNYLNQRRNILDEIDNSQL